MKIYNQETISYRCHWSGVMLTILKENYLTMSDEELSVMLGASVGAVKAKIKQTGLKRPRRNAKKEKPITPRDVRRQIRQKRKESEIQMRMNKNERMKAESKLREKAKVLATRQQDLSGMRTLRIDHKTIVYIKPGQDPEKVRKQYQRTLSKDGYSKIEY